MRKIVIITLTTFLSLGAKAQNFYPTNGNVGLGTETPTAKLNIKQDGGAWNDGLRFNLGNHSWDVVSDINGERILISRDQNSNSGISIWNGKVGIGTGAPSAKFNIQQDGGAWNDGLRFTLGSHKWDILSDHNGERLLITRDQTYSTGISIWNGNVGIGTGSPSAKFNIQQNNGAWNDGLRFSLGSHKWDILSDNNGERLLITRDQTYSTGISIWNGNVGIGTGSPSAKLTVAGKVECQEVQVTVNTGADFVFEEGYQLRDIDEVEAFVKENKHLPEIAPAAQMEAEGIDLSEMNIKLLQKIEELTLYLIEQNKTFKKQNQKILELEKEIKELK